MSDPPSALIRGRQAGATPGPFIAYDVTRLLMRCGVPSPNGIDRVDLAYARHFLREPDAARAGALMVQWRPPALLDPKGLGELLAGIEVGWRAGRRDAAAQYTQVKDRLLGRATGPFLTPVERRAATLARRLAPLRLARPAALPRALLARVPPDAAFLHTTHYHAGSLFHWLARRDDVKPVFFIHDLLPLQFPEYFALAHVAGHRRAMALVARYARAAIVNTHIVAEQAGAFLRSQGSDIPILVQPIPPDPIFAAVATGDAELADVPYFVVCGTIEPRKNHLLLLHVWRELAREHGAQTPKLVVIGQRGWENENVVDLLDRSHELRPHVIEIGGLATEAVAQMVAGARALLMPSFAEGYGLPIVEARAAGTPVIVSDIPVFREIAPDATFCEPLDGLAWLAAIKAHAEDGAPRRSTIESGTAAYAMDNYFRSIEEFIGSL